MNAILSFLLANWKTSAAGIAAICYAVGDFALTRTVSSHDILAILAGFGLVSASDAGK
jgi:hypothetical protein